MFKVSHLVEEATGRLLDMNSGPTFTDFFNICFQHCFYSLNYSFAPLGAGEAYQLIYIILEFFLGFSDLC